MPGAYHTEVVALANGFKVYLLDINFKNPIVKNSKIDAYVKGAGRRQQLTCKSQSDHFLCSVKKMPTQGELVVSSVRNNEEGSEAKYSLPIKF